MNSEYLHDQQSIITVRKRDGREVAYDHQRIETALAQAGAATGEFGRRTAAELAAAARHHLQEQVMAVEAIQDVVEGVLLASPYRNTAKAYILYRDQHAQQRERWRWMVDWQLWIPILTKGPGKFVKMPTWLGLCRA